jgi:hypothetical protein
METIRNIADKTDYKMMTMLPTMMIAAIYTGCRWNLKSSRKLKLFSRARQNFNAVARPKTLPRHISNFKQRNVTINGIHWTQHKEIDDRLLRNLYFSPDEGKLDTVMCVAANGWNTNAALNARTLRDIGEVLIIDLEKNPIAVKVRELILNRLLGAETSFEQPLNEVVSSLVVYREGRRESGKGRLDDQTIEQYEQFLEGEIVLPEHEATEINEMIFYESGYEKRISMRLKLSEKFFDPSDKPRLYCILHNLHAMACGPSWKAIHYIAQNRLWNYCGDLNHVQI